VHAEAAVALAAEHGFPVHHASASVSLGWARSDPALIAAGMEAYAAVGQRVARSVQLALLAEVQLERGDLAAACAAVEEALRFAEETGEARHLAELHRLHAECRWRQGDTATDEVESELRHALTIARRQSAGLWKERAATTLERVLGRDAPPPSKGSRSAPRKSRPSTRR
jgi:ATP/maltotriose-dependent transcriptional regulator MalT